MIANILLVVVLHLLLLLLLHIEEVESHAYLSRPISRNAIMVPENGLCSWEPNANIPCNGNPYSMNVEEPVTGCGIIQGNDPTNPTVFGSGKLGFANTGYKTTYHQGELVEMTALVGTFHGGIFEFRIQDVGANADPDGTLWDSLPLLTVEFFSPVCDKYVDEGHLTGCGRETCLQDKTCANIPLQPYGAFDNYRQDIMVKLPDDLSCKHCVLQWRYNTANSCWPDWTHCDASEKFWNCADLEIISSNNIVTNPPAEAPPAHLPWTNDCLCQFETGCVVDSDCCSGQICSDLGDNMLTRLCVENPTYYKEDMTISCKKTVTSPTIGYSDSQCTSDSDCCNPSARCEIDGFCRFPDTCGVYEHVPPASETPITSPTEVPTAPPTAKCPSNSCYANIVNANSWYASILDQWCQDDCSARSDNCISGCREEELSSNGQETIRRQLRGSSSSFHSNSKTLQISWMTSLKENLWAFSTILHFPTH